MHGHLQSRRLEEVRREEQELLEAQSVPLRNYLMKHIMPTLTSGLRDCVTIRPDDPIDFLVCLPLYTRSNDRKSKLVDAVSLDCG